MQFWKFRDVKVGVKDFFRSRDLKGKTVVDVPAGEGRMTAFLRDLGAEVIALDLFTHGTTVGDVTVRRADLTKALPVPDDSVDYILCQEGIEHLVDQMTCLREFLRLLKADGTLLITTPNASNLRARYYAFFTESNSSRHLPANEIDDVSFGEENEPCCGHLFLVGVQKLRILARLAGFKIRTIHPTRLSGTSLILFVLFYPLLVLLNLMAYYKSLHRKKNAAADKETRRLVLREMLRINLDPFVLLGNHLFVEFEKDLKDTLRASSAKK